MTEFESDGALVLIESARAAANELASALAGTTLPQDALPGYRILREIHRGGQGVVYRAVRMATGRDVAVKVMRDGPFGGPRDILRFEREVRVLAQLSHPNIVGIHDRGSAGGCHYFVMDYIAGQALDAYIDERHPPIPERLTLFSKICHAVNAAHLRGVIHRDLKPSNVRIDESGEPHVLDFGLAKIAMEETEEAASRRQMTLTRQFVGTLPWASPEQADGPAERVDLRSDVYSLGVILYYMLTGAFPYPVQGSLRRVVGHILESEPIRPRTIWKTIDEDVETIVLKCLAKEPERRYQSVAAVIEDIERYLKREPILARTPSTIYQLKKLVIRHKLTTALLMALALTVVGFAAAMSILYSRATMLLSRAQGAEALADERRVKAEDEAAKTEAINVFLGRILQFQSPWKRRTAPPGSVKTAARDVKLSELLDEAATWIESDFVDQPELKATVHLNLGQGFAAIGRDAESLAHIRLALEIRRELFGDEDPRTLECQLALPLPAPASPDELERMNRRNWETCRRLLGDHHPLTFWAAKDLITTWIVTSREAAEFEQLARHTMAVQKQAFDALYDPCVQSFLANFLVRQNRLQEAESLACETMEMAHQQGGDYWVGFNKMVLGASARRRGDFVAAELLFREAIDMQKRCMGGDHELTSVPMIRLGDLLYAAGRFDDAEAVLREAIDINLRAKGTAGDFTPRCLYVLCRVLEGAGKLVEAEQLHRRWLSDCHTELGPNHPKTFNAMTELAEFLRGSGRNVEAEALARMAVEGLRGIETEKSYHPAHAAKTLACILCDLGRREEAVPFFAEALAGFQNLIPDDRMNIPGLQLQYGRCLASMGRYDDAEPLLLASQSTFESLPDETDNLAQTALESIIELYEAWGQEDKVAEWRAALQKH